MKLFRHLATRQTLASFEYEWRLVQTHERDARREWELAVARRLTEQELCIDPAWFPGRRVLDVGCGLGRWLEGFRQLGCDVTAVEASPTACETLRARYVGDGQVQIVEGDLFTVLPVLPGKYDLVWSWGVLHHTGRVREALSLLGRMVAPDGLLYLFLYGRESGSWRSRLGVPVIRAVLAPLSFALKTRVLTWFYGRGPRLTAAFDQWSPLINTRHDPAEVTAWLEALGFPCVFRPYPRATQVFLRASRRTCSAAPFFRPAWTGSPWWQPLLDECSGGPAR